MKLLRSYFVILACCHVSSFVIPAVPAVPHKILYNLPTSATTTSKALLRNNPSSRRNTIDTSLTMSLPDSILAGRNALHGDPTFVLSSILLLSIFGVALERRTLVGKALSAPLATMALSLTVANLGLVPFSSPVCKLSPAQHYVMQTTSHPSYRLDDKSILGSSCRSHVIV